MICHFNDWCIKCEVLHDPTLAQHVSHRKCIYHIGFLMLSASLFHLGEGG